MIDALQFTFTATITEPPIGSQLRFNAVALAAVTKIWVRFTTDDGIDAFYGLHAIPAGVYLYVQDKNNHLQYARFQTTAAPIEKVDYFEVPVVWVSDGGVAFSGAQAVLLVQPSDLPAPLARVNPQWLTYDEAIAQLRRGPEEDRATIEAAIPMASAVILDYLKGQGDATWTPTTVPLQVKQATLLMLTHSYEHRGDDQRLDADLWEAIDRLLMRSRDPALA